jgi:hypothetical protein
LSNSVAALQLGQQKGMTNNRVTCPGLTGLTRFIGARVTQKVLSNWENRRGELKASCYYATL